MMMNMQARFRVLALVGLALLGLPASVSAQTPPARVPPTAREHSPLALPGDNPPPPLESMMAPPRPQTAQTPRPPAPPPPMVDGPGAALALEAAQAALARCSADGLKVGVAVSDSAGNLLVGLTMDGVAPGRIYNAARKNLVAIAFKLPSSTIQTRLRAGDSAIAARVTPAMAVFPGALPLMAGERVIGAIGISGQANGKDDVCAGAGVAAIASKLPR